MSDYAAAFDIDASTVQHFGHPIFIWDGPQELHTHRAVLAGEAACVVDPFTAEGIRPSIFSGLKAAEAIAQARKEDHQLPVSEGHRALADYSQIINTEWGKEMRWARRLARLVYSAPALAYQAGVKRPSSTLTMVKVFCGEVSYTEVAHRAIQRLSKGLLS